MRLPLALLLLAVGAAAFCEPFQGVPAVCASLIPIGNLVWIAPGTTQTATATNLSLATAAIPLVGKACGDPAIYAACLSQFRECGSDGLPRPVCPRICTNFVGNCSSNPLVAPSLPNCSMSDAVIPSELFYQTSRASQDGTNVTQECVAGDSAVSVGCGSVPFPFELNPATGNCELTCPSPTLNKKTDMKRMHIMYRVMWPISFGMQLFLMFPWIVQFRLQNPFYPLFFLIAVTFISLSYAFSVVTDYESWICKTHFKARTQYNSAACWFQGAFLHMGVMGGATTITFILYHLLNVVKQNRFQLFGEGRLIPVRPIWAYLVFSFGIPLTFIIATSASFGYSAENGMVCLPDAISGNRWHMDAVFFFPIQVLLMMDLFLTVVLFWSIYKLGSWRALRSQVRLLALCLYYMAVVGYGQAYLIYNRVGLNELRSDIEKYVLCLLGSPDSNGVFYPAPAGRSCESFYVNPYPDYWARWVSQLLGITTGLGVFAIFYRHDLLLAWRALFTGEWRQIKNRTFTTSRSPSASPSASPQVSGNRDSGGINESRF